MKRSTVIVIFSFLFVVQLLAQEKYLFIQPARENIRISPNGKKIGELFGGVKVKILENKTDWVKVQFTGWIWKNSLTSDIKQVEGFTIRVSHILVSTEAEARQILEKLKSGASFEQLAKQYSIDSATKDKGGDLGTFKRGELLKEIEDIVFNLDVGEFGGIAKTKLGYHILKRTE